MDVTVDCIRIEIHLENNPQKNHEAEVNMIDFFPRCLRNFGNWTCGPGHMVPT